MIRTLLLKLVRWVVRKWLSDYHVSRNPRKKEGKCSPN